MAGKTIFYVPPKAPVIVGGRSRRWRTQALTTTKATATRGDRVTRGECRTWRNPLATAAARYTENTAACKRAPCLRSAGEAAEATSVSTASAGGGRMLTRCSHTTNPATMLVRVPVMYVVAMPGTFRWRMAAL